MYITCLGHFGVFLYLFVCLFIFMIFIYYLTHGLLFVYNYLRFVCMYFILCGHVALPIIRCILVSWMIYFRVLLFVYFN